MLLLDSKSDAPASKFRNSWRARHKFLFYTLVLIAGVILAKAAFSINWNLRQARKLAGRAHVLMLNRKWKEAVPLLANAYRKAPNDVVVLHECAYFERVGDKNIILSGFYLKQLVALGAATSEDRAYLGQALIAEGDIPAARLMLETIPAADHESHAALWLQSMIALKDGDEISGTELLRRALALDSDNPESRLKAAIMDLQDPLFEMQEKAVAALWNIARMHSDESVVAINTLAAHPYLTATQSKELLDLVSANNSAGESLRYTVLSAYIKQHPGERTDVLNREIASIPTGDETRLAQLARWLIAESEYDQVLKLITREDASGKDVLFECYVEALVRKKSWTELKDFLVTSKSLPTSQINVLQLRARCANASKEPPAVVMDFLTQARQLAAKAADFNSLEFLAGTAASMGFAEISIDCLRATSLSSPARWEKNLEQILSLQRTIGDIPAMLGTLNELKGLKKTSTPHFDAYVYLKLVSGIELETVMDECEVFVEHGNISPDKYAFFKALAAYRHDDMNNLKSSLQKINPKKLPLNWRAVCAGMLGYTGDRALAFQLSEKIAVNTLTEDERNIFKDAL